jgi:asparagine synthase (glutamine-hydrolysing)
MKNIFGTLKDISLSLQLSPLARSVKRQNITYLSSAKLLRLENVLRVASDRPKGVFLEFGVALGGSAILIAMAAKNKCRFYGFDVFGTIPPPTSEKDDEKSKRRYETIVSKASPGIGGEMYYGYRPDLLNDVASAFAHNGLKVDGQDIALVKGLFQETWPMMKVGEVAFCHIDCDWYDPVKFCLDAVGPILAENGMILLDDYHDYGGCRIATNEFLMANIEFEMLDGPNVVLKRRSQGSVTNAELPPR